ncbi:MAG: hypothetical protein WA916_08930 [Arcobacter sp.]|uniref:hypothetical protein n=1 Tax=Arcobacter sp. TaxID=1872629 RepID=UPI003C776610
MAQTLGEQYDQILADIRKAQNSQSYQNGDKQFTRGTLFRLYEERDRILDKINSYGRNYTEGQNTTPLGDTSFVSFK